MANPIDYYGDITLHGGKLRDVAIETVGSLPKTSYEGHIVANGDKVQVYLGGNWVALGSSADITTVQEALDALTTRVTTAEGKITTLETDMGTAKTNITALQNGKINTSDIVTSLTGEFDNKVPSEKAVKSAIDTAITGAYKYAGNVASKEELAGKDKVNGAIYNVTATFTTDEGVTFKEGTNIVYDSASARWEMLSGIIDTSIFQLVDNLQNSLVADESNTKYPTVTAVNAGLDGKVDKINIGGGTFTKVEVNAQGQVTSGQTHITASDISDFATEVAKVEVETAKKLATARNFSITGGATASAVPFDGTGAVELNVTSVSGAVVSGLIPEDSVPVVTSAKISDFATKVQETVGVQFKTVALNESGKVTKVDNKYTIATTAGKMAFGVMVLTTAGVQVFVSTTVTAGSIVLDFNSAIDPAGFKVTYIEQF